MHSSGPLAPAALFVTALYNGYLPEVGVSPTIVTGCDWQVKTPATGIGDSNLLNFT